MQQDEGAGGEVEELRSLAAGVQARLPVLPLENVPGTGGGGSEHPNMVASSTQGLEIPPVKHSVVTKVLGKDYEGTPQEKATLDWPTAATPA